MIKRLFVKLPLYVLFFTVLLTVITPIGYWVITGNDPMAFFDKIEKI